MKVYTLEAQDKSHHGEYWPDNFAHIRKGYKPHCGPCRDPRTCGCIWTVNIEQFVKEIEK